MKANIRLACELRHLTRYDALLERGWVAITPLLVALDLPEPGPVTDADSDAWRSRETGAIPHNSDGAVAELLFAVVPPRRWLRQETAHDRLMQRLTSYNLPGIEQPILIVRVRALKQRGEIKRIAAVATCSKDELLYLLHCWVFMRGYALQVITGDRIAGIERLYRTYPPE